MALISEVGQAGFSGEVGWDGSAVYVNEFTTAYIEVTTFNTAITVNTGVQVANAIQVLNVSTGASTATITATGLYAVPAVGNLSLSGNSGSVVNLILKR